MTSVAKGQRSAHGVSRKLASWKDIAGYFGCDERTAKRWEHERQMPVHRAPGKRSGVFAYSEELDAWLESRAREDGLRSGESYHKESEMAPSNASSVADDIRSDTEGESALVSAQIPSRGALVSRRWVWITAGVAALLAGGAGLLVHGNGGARTLKAVSSRPAPGTLQHVPPPEAQQLYLRGRYLWNLRTADSLSKAIDAYTQAIVKDPSYAEAYAGLAEAYDLLPQFAHADLGDSFTRAKSTADRAIQLNPNLAAAHRAKGFALLFLDWDLPGSDAEFRRALALDPNSAETHHWYASTLHSRDEGVESMRQIDEALRLSPTSAAIATDAAFIHAEFGDFDAGVRSLREIEQTQPTLATPSQFLMQFDLATEDYRDYVAEARRHAQVTGDPDELAYAREVARRWARAGKTGLLEGRAKALKAAYDRGTERGFNLGETLLLLGRPREAFPYIDAAFKKHDLGLVALQECGWPEKLASDAEYAALFSAVRQRSLAWGGPTTLCPRDTPRLR